MTDVRCIRGHNGDPCATCGRESRPTGTPEPPAEPGHCDRNPDGDLTEGSSSPYHDYHCGGCGQEFIHE